MSKDAWIAMHDQLTAEMMEETGCDWTTAYEQTADKVQERLADRLAERADWLRLLERERF